MGMWVRLHGGLAGRGGNNPQPSRLGVAPGDATPAFAQPGPALDFGFRYGTMDGRASASVPVGGNPVANTYFSPNPGNDSTGLFLGATGMDVAIDSKLRVREGMGGVSAPLAWFMGRRAMPVAASPFLQVRAGVGVLYRNSEMSHGISQQSLTFENIRSSASLTVDEDFVAPRFALEVGVNQNPGRGLFASIGGHVAPGALWTDASAHQRNLCNLCPDPAEQDFTLTHKFSRSQGAVHLGAEAMVGYRLSPELSVVAHGRVEHMSRTHAFDVPITPTDQPIGLRKASQRAASVGGGVVLTFSDARLKRDVEKLKRLDNGLKLYRYRYLWSDTEHVGVMAQEVKAVMPEAVARGADGFLRVDYARLGLRPLTLEAFGNRDSL